MKTRIGGAKATPVRMPARPDSLNSAELEDHDAAFALEGSPFTSPL